MEGSVALELSGTLCGEIGLAAVTITFHSFEEIPLRKYASSVHASVSGPLVEMCIDQQLRFDADVGGDADTC